MQFELSILIRQPPEICFAFLQNKHRHIQPPHLPVLKLEKTTSGAVAVGTRFIEVVQMLPFFKGTIHSIITRCEPPHWLAEDFEGAGMRGQLAYQFLEHRDGTRLIQTETLQMQGWTRVLSPWVQRALEPRLRQRLEEIRLFLEGEN
ncbi:MAG: hypothetical protein JW862_09130 [Anaerolineales bacterium]|nr:hypothetical protein [Anaerolineales bacterium]